MFAAFVAGFACDVVGPPPLEIDGGGGIDPSTTAEVTTLRSNRVQNANKNVVGVVDGGWCGVM